MRKYFTGLHPHVLMHLVHYGEPKFAARFEETAPYETDASELGPSSTLSRPPALESRVFYFDWRDLDERLQQALAQAQTIELEEGMAPPEAETLVDRRTAPLAPSIVRVVYNPDRDRYHFLSSGAWKLLNVFNGGKPIEVVLDSVPPDARERTLEFIRTMERAGLLCRARGGATPYQYKKPAPSKSVSCRARG
jgi:hypothetical protein